MGGHSMVYHYLDELKTDDRYSIHRDLMQLHHVIHRRAQRMDDLMMSAAKNRHEKMKFEMMKVYLNYCGHY
jgi:hypothetical protein